MFALTGFFSCFGFSDLFSVNGISLVSAIVSFITIVGSGSFSSSIILILGSSYSSASSISSLISIGIDLTKSN